MSPISLRPLTASDVNAFMTWAGDSTVTRSLFWDAYTDLEAAKKFLQEYAEKHPWFMAICKNGMPVGAITLDQRSGSACCRAELGYVMAKSHWGQGIATQATQIALTRGFNDLAIQRIEAFVDPRNISSIRVLEKAGMTHEATLNNYIIHRGELRPRYVYAQCRGLK